MTSECETGLSGACVADILMNDKLKKYLSHQHWYVND